MKSTLYKINSKFARAKGLPVWINGLKIQESSKAIKIFGQGAIESKEHGECSVCGRELTHPVSVHLGIGPECGKHYWDFKATGYTEQELKDTQESYILSTQFESWIPKSCIKEEHPSDVEVIAPYDLKSSDTSSVKKPERKFASWIEFQNSGRSGIKIVFPFDRELLNQIKRIPGRKYHDEQTEKYWTAPLSIEAIEILKELEFSFAQALIEWYRKETKPIEIPSNIEVPGLNGTLFPFQEQGLGFIEAKDGRALVADEMGLGKTVQAIAYLQNNPDKRPAIIVVPASLKLNWKKECEQWMEDPKVQILSGTKATTPIHGEILIINYDIVHAWEKQLMEIKPKVLILDEGHLIKNSKARRTKSIKKIGKRIPHCIILTGTPIVNRPREILNAVKLINPNIFPNNWEFLHKYCDPKHNGYGWDFTGASNTEHLHKVLTDTVMIRRLKADVLEDLPPKMRSFVPMELNNRKEYDKAENDFVNFLRGKVEDDLEEQIPEELRDLVKIDKENLKALQDKKAATANALTQIEALKQVAVKGKLELCVEWIEEFLESGEKLVVMATHKFVIDRLMDHFKNRVVKVDGSVPTNLRQSAVDKFQKSEKIRLFVGNIKAAGVGLTLTAASTVAFLELPWTPGDLAQAEDRVHRIGQKDFVNAFYLLAAGTIEERIANLLDAKRLVLDGVLDGVETDSRSLLSELINIYK